MRYNEKYCIDDWAHKKFRTKIEKVIYNPILNRRTRNVIVIITAIVLWVWLN